MSTTTEPEKQSFAETAMRLSGKSDDEARRLGAVDKADDQVEAMFAAQYQTVNSPVHRAIWDAKIPLSLFNPPALADKAPCDTVMEKSLEVIKRRRATRELHSAKTRKSPTISSKNLGKPATGACSSIPSSAAAGLRSHVSHSS